MNILKHMQSKVSCTSTHFHTHIQELQLLRLGLAVLTSQQPQYGKVFILLLLQPWPFLTWERDISTCPHHIPALTLNNTHLLSKLNPRPLPQKLIHSVKMFSDTLPVKPRRQLTVALLSRPNVKQHQLFQESKMSFLNYLTQKLQNVMHHKEIGREEGALVAEPTLWFYSTAWRRGGRILSPKDSLDLD